MLRRRSYYTYSEHKIGQPCDDTSGWLAAHSHIESRRSPRHSMARDERLQDAERKALRGECRPIAFRSIPMVRPNTLKQALTSYNLR